MIIIEKLYLHLKWTYTYFHISQYTRILSHLKTEMKMLFLPLFILSDLKM